MMLLFVAVAGAGAFVVYRCHKWRERWKRESPNALFYEICDAHKIDAHCRKKLIRLAEENGLEHPALLFLSPGIWEREAFQEELGEDYAKAKVAVM